MDKLTRKALPCAIVAAQAAGKVMRDNFRAIKKINSESRHDIKLELDVRCQKLIERTLRNNFPEIAVFGEEGITGDIDAGLRWVVDPIDGTVNFSHGIPHCCVSIALQGRRGNDHQTLLGVVYDPFCNELWTATLGGPAKLNGRSIKVSSRTKIDQAIVSIGFAKERFTMEKMVPTMNALISRVRKIRIMGSAALALVYVASGRTEAYIEYGVRLWDIAAGGLIIECAGGEFWRRPVDDEHGYQVIANNGAVRKPLSRWIVQ